MRIQSVKAGGTRVRSIITTDYKTALTATKESLILFRDYLDSELIILDLRRLLSDLVSYAKSQKTIKYGAASTQTTLIFKLS